MVERGHTGDSTNYEINIIVGLAVYLESYFYWSADVDFKSQAVTLLNTFPRMPVLIPK